MHSRASLVIFAFLIFSSAEAAQLGRTTRDVNLRIDPSTSKLLIGRLKAGTEVEIIETQRPLPPGWYFVNVKPGRQPGYVHKNYVKLDEDQRADHWPPSKHGKFAARAGIILAGVGILLMASVLAPDFLAIVTALDVAMVAVVVFDLWFQLGMLYSLFSVSVGTFALFLLLKRKQKDHRASADQISRKKAA
jgi:SH3 domain-containing protein